MMMVMPTVMILIVGPSRKALIVVLYGTPPSKASSLWACLPCNAFGGNRLTQTSNSTREALSGGGKGLMRGVSTHTGRGNTTRAEAKSGPLPRKDNDYTAINLRRMAECVNHRTGAPHGLGVNHTRRPCTKTETGQGAVVVGATETLR